MRYGQRPMLMLLLGGEPTPRQRLAEALERRLLADGRAAYLLRAGGLLDDAAAPASEADGALHRRALLIAAAGALLDAGLLVILADAALGADDLDAMAPLRERGQILTVRAGEPAPEGVTYDLQLADGGSGDGVIDWIASLFAEQREPGKS